MNPKDNQPSDVNARTIQLVKLLTELGPDVPEISRRLGQFKESVRYRYKEKVLNRGIAVQAAVDHERLGLKRLILVGDLNPEYVGYAQAIFAAMNELCYLMSFEKTLIGSHYILNVSAPVELIPNVKDFYYSLKAKGMFKNLRTAEFDWLRRVPMKAEFYDFDTGRWDFDWKDTVKQTSEAASYMPSVSGKFDSTDLLIIKELQMDANKSLKEISDKLELNYKKLAWHHTAHVNGGRLIRGYSVNWMGTRYDYAIDKALHRKHKYIAVDLLVRDINELETIALRQQMNKIPFLWAEASGKDYFAQIAFPLDLVVEGLQYIGKITKGMEERVEVHFLDWTDALGFTISYNLYDPSLKKWTFERESLDRRFDNLIMQIKVGTG